MSRLGIYNELIQYNHRCRRCVQYLNPDLNKNFTYQTTSTPHHHIMPLGKLSVGNSAIPAFAAPYAPGITEFSDVDIIFIIYRTSYASVRHFVPDMLELEEEPLVTTGFLDYGMSGVGAYKEYCHLVEVTYRGEKFDFTLSLVLNNESAIFSGREQFGYPKKFGNVTFDTDTGTSILKGSVERPIGQRIVQFNFAPTHRFPGSFPKSDKRTLNLRVIPSPLQGAAPSLKELIPVVMEINSKEAWLGQGSISFPEPSDFDPMHRIDILRHEHAIFVRKAECVLRHPTELFTL